MINNDKRTSCNFCNRKICRCNGINISGKLKEQFDYFHKELPYIYKEYQRRIADRNVSFGKDIENSIFNTLLRESRIGIQKFSLLNSENPLLSSSLHGYQKKIINFRECLCKKENNEMRAEFLDGIKKQILCPDQNFPIQMACIYLLIFLTTDEIPLLFKDFEISILKYFQINKFMLSNIEPEPVVEQEVLSESSEENNLFDVCRINFSKEIKQRRKPQFFKIKIQDPSKQQNDSFESKTTKKKLRRSTTNSASKIILESTFLNQKCLDHVRKQVRLVQRNFPGHTWNRKQQDNQLQLFSNQPAERKLKFLQMKKKMKKET